MKKILEDGNNMRESILVTCGAHRQMKLVLKLLKTVSRTTYKKLFAGGLDENLKLKIYFIGTNLDLCIVVVH